MSQPTVECCLNRFVDSNKYVQFLLGCHKQSKDKLPRNKVKFNYILRNLFVIIMSSASNDKIEGEINKINKIENKRNLEENESSEDNDCENFKLRDYKKIEKQNYRKRKADGKNEQTMGNDEKKIKLENTISEDENAREKMFQVSDAVNFIDFPPVEPSLCDKFDNLNVFFLFSCISCINLGYFQLMAMIPKVKP